MMAAWTGNVAGAAGNRKRIDPNGAFETSGGIWPGTGPLARRPVRRSNPARPDPGGERPGRGAFGPWRLADPLRHPAGRPGRAMRPDPERGSRGPLQRGPDRD